MGVDVGQPLLYVEICDHPKEGYRRVVWAGTVKEFEELHTIIAMFGVKWAVVDMFPETRKAQEFQEAMKGKCKVWLCRYPPAPQAEAIKVDEERKIIVADRTQTMDDYVADIYNQKVLLPANAGTLVGGDFYRQLCAPTRIYEDPPGCYRWVEQGQADDFFHAGSYEKMACQFMTGIIQEAPVQKRKSFGHRSLRRASKNA